MVRDHRDYDEVPDPDEDDLKRPRDGKIDAVKQILLSKYLSSGDDVFYARQLEIWLEKGYFHWITARALRELKEERKVGGITQALDTHKANFYYPVKHRYPKRQITEILKLIREFSDPNFTRALGAHGELLVESGFARAGFRVQAQKVHAVDRKSWKKTKHDLDFLIERDGIRYGVEVKNQLGYIDQTEFETKLEMCEFFGVRPMFIARAMPKNYIYEVYKKGGFSLLTDKQNYPLLADDLAKRVRERLKLPVGVIRSFPDTALTRFERWHEKTPKKG